MLIVGKTFPFTTIYLDSKGLGGSPLKLPHGIAEVFILGSMNKEISNLTMRNINKFDRGKPTHFILLILHYTQMI